MNLPPLLAGEVLQAARYDPQDAQGAKAPALWSYYQGTIYRFHWNNAGAWHGYPAAEKPPNAVLQQWRQTGQLSEAEFGKIRRLPARGQ
jgi:hypothetical protein